MICPRSVVVKNVEPWTVIGGNPAKFIKMRKIYEVVTGGGEFNLLTVVVSPRHLAA